MAQLWNGMSENLPASLMQSSTEGSNCLGQVETSLKTTEHLSLLFIMCLLHDFVLSVYSATTCVLLAQDLFFAPPSQLLLLFKCQQQSLLFRCCHEQAASGVLNCFALSLTLLTSDGVTLLCQSFTPMLLHTLLAGL